MVHGNKAVLKCSEPQFNGIRPEDVSYEETVCQNFTLGKSTGKPRKERKCEEMRGKKPADLVYTDVVGPLRFRSMGEQRTLF